MRDRLLTVMEAAERLALKPATVRRMVADRRIDFVRPSLRAVRIPERSIERLIKSRFQSAVIMPSHCGESGSARRVTTATEKEWLGVEFKAVSQF